MISDFRPKVPRHFLRGAVRSPLSAFSWWFPDHPRLAANPRVLQIEYEVMLRDYRPVFGFLKNHTHDRFQTRPSSCGKLVLLLEYLVEELRIQTLTHCRAVLRDRRCDTRESGQFLGRDGSDGRRIWTLWREAVLCNRGRSAIICGIHGRRRHGSHLWWRAKIFRGNQIDGIR